jgi:hypothetical protein
MHIARGQSGGNQLLFGPQLNGTLHVKGSVSHNISAGQRLLENGLFSSSSGTISSCIYSEGAITTLTGVWVSSDRRLKKCIETIDYEEAKKLLLANAVSYTWKNGPDKPECGFIAQDLLKIGLDKVVSIVPNQGVEPDEETDLKDFSLVVQYDRLTSYLLTIIKKLREEVDVLNTLVSMKTPN